jgi:hypothetical protein
MLVAAFALAVAACGDSTGSEDGATTPPPADAPASTAAPEGGGAADTTVTTAGESDGDTTSTAPAAPPPVVDGPDAPDFSLALGSGETFVLSDEQKPVYLVFWAEW